MARVGAFFESGTGKLGLTCHELIVANLKHYGIVFSMVCHAFAKFVGQVVLFLTVNPLLHHIAPLSWWVNLLAVAMERYIKSFSLRSGLFGRISCTQLSKPAVASGQSKKATL